MPRFTKGLENAAESSLDPCRSIVRKRGIHLEGAKAFSTFSVDDLQKAKQFYGQTLGLKVDESPEGLELHVGGNSKICHIDIAVFPRAFSRN